MVLCVDSYQPFYTTGNVKTIHEIVHCLLFLNCLFVYLFIVFNATFNNISVISWQSVLLVKETAVPGENDKLQISFEIHW